VDQESVESRLGFDASFRDEEPARRFADDAVPAGWNRHRNGSW
jgi:hypothetical protein